MAVAVGRNPAVWRDALYPCAVPIEYGEDGSVLPIQPLVSQTHLSRNASDPLDILIAREEAQERQAAAELDWFVMRYMLRPEELAARMVAARRRAEERLGAILEALEIVKTPLRGLGRPRTYFTDRPATSTERSRARRRRLKLDATKPVGKQTPMPGPFPRDSRASRSASHAWRSPSGSTSKAPPRPPRGRLPGPGGPEVKGAVDALLRDIEKRGPTK